MTAQLLTAVVGYEGDRPAYDIWVQGAERYRLQDSLLTPCVEV